MSYPKIDIITSVTRAPESSVLIIYTGGTLGMIHDSSGALVPFDFNSILDHVPSLRQLELTITVVAFDKPIDSSNVSPDHWIEMAKIIEQNYNEYDGFVVLHGTDTMAFSASALSFMLENLQKPVVFTGAQLPISSLRSDARENLITAIEIATAKKKGKPIVPEVSIYFDNYLLRGNRSKKVQSIHFDAFETQNYPKLAESGVVIDYNTTYILSPTRKGKFRLHDRLDNRVTILKLFPGITLDTIRAILGIAGLRGVVMETYGSGNAPTEKLFIKELKAAIDRGIVIINVSQCSGGMVMQGRYDTSKQLNKIGVLSGIDMTLEAAVTKLMMVLAEESERYNVEARMKASICGEMTLN